MVCVSACYLDAAVSFRNYRSGPLFWNCRPTDEFPILGSITKSMTATLAARIVETGAVRWQTSIGNVLGDRCPGMLAAYRDVTQLHILSHRGGLPRDVTSLRDAEGRFLGRQDYVRAALRLPPTGKAAEQMLYSNVDYVVAGLMMEIVSGG